jgi:predicted Rossmann fold flavoprotein
MMTQCDVAIVGAGPAGLMAAARAAERGRKTILLDKNAEPGVKILLSGGTRCNLTHATNARGIVEAFGPNGRFLHSALAALGPQQVVEMFAAEGVPTKVEPGGKVFPASDRAADVRDALLRRAKRAGCALAMAEPLLRLDCSTLESQPRNVKIAGSQRLPEGVTISGDSPGAVGSRLFLHAGSAAAGFQLTTASQTIEAHKVVLTTGGQSYPSCGTTGDGYRLAAALGHRIVPPHPALVPITSHAPWVLALQGITLPDVLVKVCEDENQQGVSSRSADRPLAVRRGSLLFTHFGVSGPVILDISHVVSGHARPTTLVLRCDLLPEINQSELDDRLAQEQKAGGKRHVASLLDCWLPHRVGETIVALSGATPELPAGEFSKPQRRQLVQTVKGLEIPVAGTMGFRKAEVTAGGVSLDEIDSRTMQSRLVPGLFFAGELLDLNGPEGGYNFQAAFSTGWLAGESV